MSDRIKAWSPSRYAVYKKCPLQAKHKFILKTPEPEKNWATDRGTILHAHAENFIKGNITTPPDQLDPFKKELKTLQRLQAETEVDLTITAGWKPTYAQDWGGAWCRTKADVIHVVGNEGTYIDHKTGKVYEDSVQDQAEISALASFVHYPKIKLLDAEFWYYDQKDEAGKPVVLADRFYMKDFTKLRKKWIANVKPMLNDTEFKPKKNEFCNFCNFKHLCPLFNK